MNLQLHPGFFRASQGIWQLTWRCQLTWRRLPFIVVTLLTIPLLVYFTIEPLQKRMARYDWRPTPHQQVNEFKAKAIGANVPLKRGIGTQLTQIISDEYGRVQPPQRSAGASRETPFSQEALDRQIEEVRSCHERIRERARAVLEARQFGLFDEFLEGETAQASEQIKKWNLQSLRPYYHWLVNFYFLLVLPFYCLTACGAMIRDDLQSDTLGFLITRPVGRARLFLIKYLCQMLWLQSLVGIHTALLFAVGWLRDVPGVGSVWLLFFAIQALAVLAWGALSALLGLITRRYLVLGIVYGFVVELGIGRIPTNINALSLTRHLQALLSHNPLLNELYEWAPERGGWAAGILLLATAIFLGTGMMLFVYREYHHVAEMQK